MFLSKFNSTNHSLHGTDQSLVIAHITNSWSVFRRAKWPMTTPLYGLKTPREHSDWYPQNLWRFQITLNVTFFWYTNSIFVSGLMHFKFITNFNSIIRFIWKASSDFGCNIHKFMALRNKRKNSGIHVFIHKMI